MVKNLGKSTQREQFHERYRFDVKNVTRRIVWKKGMKIYSIGDKGIIAM